MPIRIKTGFDSLPQNKRDELRTVVRLIREELEWLAERVSKLQKLMEEICKKTIATFMS